MRVPGFSAVEAHLLFITEDNSLREQGF